DVRGAARRLRRRAGGERAGARIGVSRAAGTRARAGPSGHARGADPGRRIGGDMAGDVPLLDRLARLAPVSAASAASLVERLAEPNADPVIGPLFGTDEDGDTVVNPLVPAVLQALAQKEGLTCYALRAMADARGDELTKT